jgi:polyhydroxyalkanoate synthesis repressor PhaR
MRIIKKYSNRRLYDTTASAYVNLEELAAHVRKGEQLQVVDASTGDDLTRATLLQIILEAQGGVDMLPPGLLHRIIRMSGDSPTQRMAMQQISVGLQMVDNQLLQLERQLGWWKSDPAPEPPPEAKRAAPEPPPEEAPPRPSPTPSAASPATEAAAPDAEMDALRARLAALESRLKKS